MKKSNQISLNGHAEQSNYAVSLFSGAGIGDLGFRACGIEFLAMCEIESDRSDLAKLNFPNAEHFPDDIEKIKGDICNHVRSKSLFLIACTAPCQGMSKNGQGTLLNNIRKGQRPKLDPRNRLILPGLEIISRLQPEWAVFENVIEMRNTVIEESSGNTRPILDIIDSTLQPLGYVGEAYDIEFADYGIPQRRQRLITVYGRSAAARDYFSNGVPFIPPTTHSRKPDRSKLPWVTVEEAIKTFPPLDARDDLSSRCDSIPFHYVPVLDPKKYEWIRNTPLRKSAFDNQCINAACKSQSNATHGASHGKDGINRAHKNTPLFCEQCGALLPRPYTEENDGTKRIMSGYTSAYKRMDGSLPAPALTRNLSYPCSDQKIHPTQNRVLSLAEAMRLHTLDRYEYRWGPLHSVNAKGKSKSIDVAPNSLIRLVIGESVPPFFLELLGSHLLNLSACKINKFARVPAQGTLF